MELDKEKLAKFIKEAADAHHEYELTLDQQDAQWPEWYANYILERLNEETGVFEEDVFDDDEFEE